MTGKLINDRQAKLYMDLINTPSQKTAAAKAGFSIATARRLEADPRMPSQKRTPRSWRTRKDPFEGLFESEIVPLLERAPNLMATTLLAEMQRRHPRALRRQRAAHLGAARRTMTQAARSG